MCVSKHTITALHRLLMPIYDHGFIKYLGGGSSSLGGSLGGGLGGSKSAQTLEGGSVRVELDQSADVLHTNMSNQCFANTKNAT